MIVIGIYAIGKEPLNASPIDLPSDPFTCYLTGGSSLCFPFGGFHARAPRNLKGAVRFFLRQHLKRGPPPLSRVPSFVFWPHGTFQQLGPPVVPFYPFLGEGSPTKIDYRRKGTLILTSLLEDLGKAPPKKKHTNTQPAQEQQRLTGFITFQTCGLPWFGRLALLKVGCPSARDPKR